MQPYILRVQKRFVRNTRLVPSSSDVVVLALFDPLKRPYHAHEWKSSTACVLLPRWRRANVVMDLEGGEVLATTQWPYKHHAYGGHDFLLFTLDC